MESAEPEITSAVARVLVWSPGERSGQSGALMMVPAPFHEQRHETVCLPVCSLPGEGAMRRRPSLPQEECPPHTLTLPELLAWTSSLPDLGEIRFSCKSLPAPGDWGQQCKCPGQQFSSSNPLEPSRPQGFRCVCLPGPAWQLDLPLTIHSRILAYTVWSQPITHPGWQGGKRIEWRWVRGSGF